MSDEPVFRHDDYLAMAEHQKQLIRRIEELQKKPPRDWPFLWLCLGAGFVGMTAYYFLVFVVHWSAQPGRPKPPPQLDPCFFISQDKDYGEVLPWNKWHLHRLEGCCGSHQINKDGKELVFDSKEQAWSFLQQWKLPACR